MPVIDLFFRQVYLFFIVERCSRRVVHLNVTPHPTNEWIAQQLREATPFDQRPRFLIQDRDRKYGQRFATVAKDSQIEILKTPYRAPKANAICERFLGSVRRECLDHLLILGESHLYRVIKDGKRVEFFNQARPHQGIEQKIPEGIQVAENEHPKGKIIAFPGLNGLHHDYRRAA
ncbi:MAG: DDE-type integrase/transposase/recombinase [Chloroflexi bacterium]|nr:DDE-type integrase/transposase/recombinase [Chloroflexota bacterium]